MPILGRFFGGKSWNPKDYAKKDKGRWIVTPGVFYPAMIQHIKESLASGDLPAELIDRQIKGDVDPTLAAKRYRGWGRRISDQAWADALRPLGQVRVKDWRNRAEALECARLWFTRALKNREAPPVYIKILKDDRFKLGVDKEFRA